MRLFILSVLVAVAACQYTGPLPWNLDRLDQQRLPLDGAYKPFGTAFGDQSIVYVLGTGIEKTHENFGPAFNRAFNIYDFQDGGDGSDTDGAGTAFAGVIAGQYTGVASKTNIGIVRVNDRADPTTLNADFVIAGMTAALNHYKNLKAANPVGHLRGVAVAPLSVTLDANRLAEIEELTRDMAREGITVVGPVGDAPSAGDFDCQLLSPARLFVEPGVVIVGGTTRTDNRHPNSVAGGIVHCAEIYAPGHEVTSSYIGNSYGVAPSDTAFAAAHVAGVAALLRSECPDLTEREVETFLIEGSRVYGSPALDLDGTPLPSNIVRVPHADEPADCNPPARR
ncbi:alkaline serine exoprotease A-like [Ptychodera flava]|uniref:alkaline serine exoprotease A-like n=1 Tax=Ptychodera flava TaxID=63121 RepID=UPI003969C860